VVDFVGNAGRHKLMTTADILGGKAADEAVALAAERAKASGKPVRMDEEIQKAEADIAERLRQAARRAQLKARATWSASSVNPFDVFALAPARERGWDAGRVLSEKQRALLERQGIDPASVTYTQGRQLLTEIFRRWDAGLCSYKQARVLRKHGFDGNVSREEAGRILDGIFGRGKQHGMAEVVKGIEKHVGAPAAF